ncbi:hypothetical protein MACH17_15650 [Phaeobacter inhibens]|uniref:S8 family serine peptidase n=1 Tax=Phaeobacter inhibens TaxID=221822 RepID=UPI0027739F9E|nr:S8 family serine peptidase [Phaeobacter inhibens]GLO70048.1 hypothetical protein MACH17_15650 [Phaeobacter inhibens]
MDQDDGGLELRADATALAPERLLVFEVRGSVSNFANAVRNIPGLELVDEEALPTDESDNEPTAYLLVPNDAALREVLSLWRRWISGRSMAIGFTPWRDVFQTLRDVRAWGPKDRVSKPEQGILVKEIEGRADDELITLEIELVYRADESGSEKQVKLAILDAGGRILSRARIDDIAYHALLVQLPVSSVRKITDFDENGVAGLEPIQHIRPQSLMSAQDSSKISPADSFEIADPLDEPILALIDGVPMQRHPWLAAHVIVDDAFGLEEAALVRDRLHGTAMASLIVHGDRNNAELPLGRKIISVPVLGSKDKFPTDRLIVDMIYQAVLGLRLGDEPPGQHVVIINMSLGNVRRPFHGLLSPWARLLDRLAYRFGILFVVSAGNICDPFEIDGYSTRTDFEDSVSSERSKATICALDALKAERRLFSPAETVNGLTIGARNRDFVAEDQRRLASSNIDPHPDIEISNPSSAMGPGFGNSVKPELLFPGSKEHLNVVSSGSSLVVQPAKNPSRAAGLRVAAPPKAGIEAGEGYSNGTSAAAALASRTAHRIHEALEAEYEDEFLSLSPAQRATLLKALLVHPASWQDQSAGRIKEIVGPSDGRQHVKQKDNIRRFLGYGSYEMDAAVACAADRATFWAVGDISADQTVPISVPIPLSYGGKARFHSVTATLAWMTPVNAGRQSYRAVRLKMSEPENLGTLAVAGNSTQPDQNQMSRGTVATRHWSGNSAAVVSERDELDFEISRMRDGEGRLSFAFAVTVRMPGVNEIYDQARAVIRPALRARG